MRDDELRELLTKIDPVPASVPVDLPTSLRAKTHLERAMLTTEPTPKTTTAAPAWRRPAVLASGVAVVLALVAAGVLAVVHDSTPGRRPLTVLSLKTPGDGGAVSLGSCLPFDTAVLRDVPLAFAGTVTATSAGQVDLSVDHWYKGGTAQVVRIATPPTNTSVGTVELTPGKRYLVTATNGVVNGCGLTGEATPDLVKAFDQAFAS